MSLFRDVEWSVWLSAAVVLGAVVRDWWLR